jgi:hypothetical protein
MQKWEYAHIHYSPNDYNSSLNYLRPSGPEHVAYDTKVWKNKEFGQLCAWITRLGQEGYEMTGVAAGGLGYLIYTYWFKRPLT